MPMPKTHPTILIDDRSGSQDLIKYYPLSTYGVLTKLSDGTNPSADVAIYGNGPNGSTVSIGIEFKKLSDLIDSSLVTKRLQATQIPHLLDNYDEQWILYCGRYRCSPVDHVTLQVWKDSRGYRPEGWYDYTMGKKGNLNFGSMEAFLCSPSLTRLGIKTKHVETIEQAAAWLGVLARVWDKDYKDHKSMEGFDESAKRTLKNIPADSNGMSISPFPSGEKLDDDIRAMAEFAITLPGIGYKRAILVAHKFDSIHDMCVASVADWAEVIGITYARAVVNRIRSRKSSKL